MGFKESFGKVLEFIGVTSEEEYEDVVDVEDDDVAYKSDSSKSVSYKVAASEPVDQTSGKIYSITKPKGSEITFYNPQKAGVNLDVISYIRSGKSGIVRLDSLDEATCKEEFDCIKGGIYALDGKVTKLANFVYLLSPKNANVIDVNVTYVANRANVEHDFEIRIFEPTSFNDIKEIVKYLREDKPTVVKLNQLDERTRVESFDFLKGALYAIDGNIEKLTEYLYLMVPKSVKVNFAHSTKPTIIGEQVSGIAFKYGEIK